jgi:hypothetical protein
MTRILAVASLKALRRVVPLLPKPVLRWLRRRVEGWEQAMQTRQ